MAAALSVTCSATKIQNLLLCDVCKETMNEPKILPCSHSFCKACLENMTTQDEKNVDGEGQKLDCPTCRSTVTLKPDGNVTGLPDNKFVVKLLAVIGPNRKQEVCVCSHPRCKEEPSITICMECEMLFCQECYTSHEGFPLMKNHTMLTISEVINRDEQQEIEAETLSCTRHEDAISTFYCETCGEFCCITCMASVHKKEEGHTCVVINEIYRKQQEAAKSKREAINEALLEGTKVDSLSYTNNLRSLQGMY